MAILGAASNAAAGSSSSSDPCFPEQLIISPGTPADSTMWVNWATEANCTSQVELHVSASSSRVVVKGQPPATYDITDAKFGWYASPFLHHVLLHGLDPATEYHYRAGGIPLFEGTSNSSRGSAPDVLYSALRTFRTLAVGEHAPVRFAVVGDLGQTEDSSKTIDEVNRSMYIDYTTLGNHVRPSMMMLVGDLSYADGNGFRWDSWGKLMSPTLSELPLVAFPGNHEVEIDSLTAETFKHFRSRFRMPEVRPEVATAGTLTSWAPYDVSDISYDFGSSYFSFDVGMVHIVCMNTYTSNKVGSSQYQWLSEDLDAVNRSATPWVLVFAHAPLYNSNLIHGADSATVEMREAIEPLLHEHRIAAFFAGHVHACE